MMVRSAALFALFAASCWARIGGALSFQASPIRQILNMLQMMGKKCDERERHEDRVFDEFMCYCKKNSNELKASIDAAQEKIPQLEASQDDLTAEKTALQDTIKSLKQSKADAEAAMKEATSMREAENAAYKKETKALEENIKALQGAMTALQKADEIGDTSAFLQSDSGHGFLSALQTLQQNGEFDRLQASDRDMLQDFMKQAQGSGEGSSSNGEIIGILSQMLDEMNKDLETGNDEEAKAKSEFQKLMAGKEEEVKALTTAIEQKETRYGAVKVQLAETKHDLADTKEGLVSDEALFASLSKECADRKNAYSLSKKDLSDEREAITQTVKILSADEAQNLFAKTMPCPDGDDAAAASFMQTGMLRRRHAIKKGVQLLKTFANTHGNGAALARQAEKLVREGSPDSFAKLGNLITRMISLLDKEQEDDDLKKQMCTAELRRKKEQEGFLQERIAAKNSELDNAKSQLGSAQKDVENLMKGIAELDASVAEATKERKEAHAYFVEVLADSNAAVELLEKARDRLACFYKGKAGTGGGDKIDNMLGSIVSGLQSEMAELKQSETDDQESYESILKASTEKRETDAMAVTERSTAKATHETKAEMVTKKLSSQNKELSLTQKVISELHDQCDWLLDNYSERYRSRQAEKDGLGKAHDVLSGTDFSMMQA